MPASRHASAPAPATCAVGVAPFPVHARECAGGFKAVELRHADVELHLNRSVEGGQAVADDFHAINTETLQRLAGDLLVHLAVIGDENICVGKLRQGFALSRGL